MNIKSLVPMMVVSLLVLSLSSGVVMAEQSDAAAELKALVSKIETKFRAGAKTEAALAPELSEFDELLTKHKGEKTDDVAQILFMKAEIYQMLDAAKGKALGEQLKREFPDSAAVKMLKQQEEAEKVRAALAEGTKFPDFNEKDLNGQPLSVANYAGKVVLVDFWATWCGPCVQEIPNVIKTYQAHHKDGFEIIGISLDGDRQSLTSFTKEKNMTWAQYFDGKGWQNKLAAKYGVNSIPATYLLDRQGTIIGKDLRGEALEQAVVESLAKK